MERVAIQAIRSTRALTSDDLKHDGKAGYEGEVPRAHDENAVRSRQHSRHALSMIPHACQVVVLRRIDQHGNGDLRDPIVSEGRRVRRHEHDGAYPRIAELGEK